MSLLYAGCVALGVALLATPACRLLASWSGVLDLPAPRKVHAQPTPLLGGVAVFAGFATATALFQRPVVPVQTLLLLSGAAAFGLIGLVDDLRDVGAVKLLAEAAVVTAIVWLGGFSVALPWPGAGQIIAVLWIVGVANAVNCLDCTDGVAAGVAVVAACALVALALAMNRWGVAVAAAATAGAALGFLRYNFPPARIFLGDAGSLMLGFILAALAAALAAPRISAGSVAPLAVLSVPVGDFLLVHARRYRQGLRSLGIVTSTGKDHLPHRLLHAGLSSREVAVRIYRASALSAASAVALLLWGLPAALVPAIPLVASAFARPAAGVRDLSHLG